jgi:hypothetical protein
MLAHPQRTLSLFGNPCPERLADQLLHHGAADRDDGTEQPADDGVATARRGRIWQDPSSDAARGARRYCGSGSPESGSRGMRWNAATATLDLHPDLTDLQQGVGGTVEKLGPATLDLLHDWLQRLDRVTIRPVLDTTHTDATDTHDPPEWIREIVILRDRHCVFPGCELDARACDLDHITPYVSPDDGGPPEQTSPANLACLCRRHHRLKTFTAWTYTRTPDGDYRWTSPHRRTYLVTPIPKR